MDISSLAEEERCGARYTDQPEAAACPVTADRPGTAGGDLLTILKQNGVNYLRLRLWNDPYSESGEPYGAGGNDISVTLALAARAKAASLPYLLDLQYSDFWADPGKQTKPKAWSSLSVKGLEEAVYDYTKTVLQAMAREGVLPQMVQVGNELSNGLLWPEGRTPNYDNIVRFVNAGIRAVREVAGIPVMIHLDNGGNNALYREWFDHFCEKGEPFDCIGLSYYPFWHGSLQDLAANMNDIAVRYGKDLIVAETSTGFTMEDYAAYEKLPQELRKGMATRPALAAKVPYPMSPQGQCDFLRDLCQVIREVPDHRGKGFFYWEGAWIPRHGSEWATPAACRYIADPGPGGNEWANQALFDYEGAALPALHQFKEL